MGHGPRWKSDPLRRARAKGDKFLLRVPRNVLMPIILLFCGVGAFAINHSVFDVGVMMAAGVLAWLMEANGFPIAQTRR